jgi:hypothetical protein
MARNNACLGSSLHPPSQPSFDFEAGGSALVEKSVLLSLGV